MEETKPHYIQRARSGNVGIIQLEFTFGDDKVTHKESHKKIDRTVAIAYESIDLNNPETVVVKNARYRKNELLVFFFGALLMAIAGGIGKAPPDLLPVLCVAALAWAGVIVWRTTGEIKYVIFKAGTRTLPVIDNADCDAIIRELKAHWIAKMRKLYAEINPQTPLEKEIAKFKWLKKNAVIDENEYQQIMTALEQKKTPALLPGEKPPTYN